MRIWDGGVLPGQSCVPAPHASVIARSVGLLTNLTQAAVSASSGGGVTSVGVDTFLCSRKGSCVNQVWVWV